MKCLVFLVLLVLNITDATEYHGKCEIDAQCEWLGENSLCQYDVCMCKEGFRWYQGQCKPYKGLGEPCTEPSECYDGYNLLGLTCTEQKCACSSGYYLRDNADCRKIATKKDQLCALDIDCQYDANAKCVLGKCGTESSTIHVHEENVEIYEFSKITEFKATVEVACTTNEECVAVPNSECYSQTGSCVCKRGHFLAEDGSSCIAELGVPTTCKKDADCPIKPGKCLDGVCYCRDYYFTENGNRNCVKTMSQGNWNCLSREWCYALGQYSYCSSEETCKCSKIAELDEDNSVCRRVSDDDQGICVEDLECHVQLRNSYCIDESCQCTNNYRPEEDRCLPNIGAKCDNEDLPCLIDHANCDSDATCSCETDYVASDGTKCYEVSDNLGGSCEVDEQCSAKLQNSRCDGTCVCLDDYLPNGNSCISKKKYGDYCTTRLQCTVSLGDDVYCRNSICQCDTGEVRRDDKCVSSARMNGQSGVIVILLLLGLKCFL